jgi:hypothetical protein
LRAKQYLFKTLTGIVFYLSSEFAFGSLRDVFFIWPPPPIPKEKDNTFVSEAKANSEKKTAGSKTG